MTTIMGITFGSIRNVFKDCLEEGVYHAEVEISPQEGFPLEWHNYCARHDDLALTGKWVYQQIIDGNFEGEMQLTVAETDASLPSPVSTGTQTL